jgi:hypothetical protein
MTWLGPAGYPKDAHAGRCYITGMLGMLRYQGENDVLFADGISGDGFSFRWCPAWGCPAFNGGKGPFHEIWEYTPATLGFRSHWTEDPEGGWEEAWEALRGLIDRGLPVQVGLHYSLLLPYGAKSSPRLAYMYSMAPPSGFGHHVVVAGYDLGRGTVTIYEPNDILPHARYECPIPVFRQAWAEAVQRRNGYYVEWPTHYPFDGEASLHDGYGPYQMMWVEPGRDLQWDITRAIGDSFRRNLKILRGEYPKPYSSFGSQWQIPHWETGVGGMKHCAEAVRDGRLSDIKTLDGKVLKLFAQANIPNHGVLGRAGAAGYLRRVASELHQRGMESSLLSEASDHMQNSSDLFRKLCNEGDLAKAADLLSLIAEEEFAVLNLMERSLPEIRKLFQISPSRRRSDVSLGSPPPST